MLFTRFWYIHCLVSTHFFSKEDWHRLFLSFGALRTWGTRNRQCLSAWEESASSNLLPSNANIEMGCRALRHYHCNTALLYPSLFYFACFPPPFVTESEVLYAYGFYVGHFSSDQKETKPQIHSSGVFSLISIPFVIPKSEVISA